MIINNFGLLLLLFGSCVGAPGLYGYKTEYNPPRRTLRGAYTELEPQYEQNDQDVSPSPYSFGYKVKDEEGNEQHRQETGNDQGVKGSYGYTDAYGQFRFVEYIADENGFRAYIRSNEPGLSDENPAGVEITKEEAPTTKVPSRPKEVAPAPSYRHPGYQQGYQPAYQGYYEPLFHTGSRNVPVYSSIHRYED